VKIPCVAVDVSKGKSFFQGFIDLDKPINKATPINHDLEGFELMTKIGDKLKQEYNDVVYIFEATGIYHKNLQSYLDNRKEKYIILNPLEAAKVRKSHLRSTKTDKRDCLSIAKAYFLRDYPIHQKQDDIYQELQSMNRHYEYLVKKLRLMKTHFRTLLDVVFPMFDKLFENIYTSIPITVLKLFSHPIELKKRKLESITKHLVHNTNHRESYCRKEAIRLKQYATTVVSGVNYDNYLVSLLKSEVIQIENQLKELDLCINKMKTLAENIPLYYQLQTIPGIGEVLAVRLIAEMGDLSRFTSKWKLVAYAGLDPTVYQSGQMTGEHLRITKKGNKRLRTLVYLAVSSNIKSKKPNSIKEYYKKKRQQANPLAHKAALVACANKLLRIIYSMSKSGTNFHY